MPATRFPAALLTLLTVGMGADLLGGATGIQAQVEADAPPPGVKQILPRGRIAAIFRPQFVSAAVADIPADAWVLGVDVDGAPRAYSLNLLDHHEIVNDQVGDKTFAAVW